MTTVLLRSHALNMNLKRLTWREVRQTRSGCQAHSEILSKEPNYEPGHPSQWVGQKLEVHPKTAI